MSDDPPAPLVPADVDLRDLPRFPMKLAMIQDPVFFALATGDEFKAAISLWLASWHQLPAASLPADDRSLSRLSGSGRGWRRVKSVALGGFVLCSDGRLYHPTIAASAASAWTAKLKIRAKIIRRLGVESGIWADLRAEVFLRDDFTCRYCGSRGARLECDHIIPLSRGGETLIENLVTACLPCNRSKGSKHVAEWLQ